MYKQAISKVKSESSGF